MVKGVGCLPPRGIFPRVPMSISSSLPDSLSLHLLIQTRLESAPRAVAAKLSGVLALFPVPIIRHADATTKTRTITTTTELAIFLHAHRVGVLEFCRLDSDSRNKVTEEVLAWLHRAASLSWPPEDWRAVHGIRLRLIWRLQSIQAALPTLDACFAALEKVHTRENGLQRTRVLSSFGNIRSFTLERC